MQMLGYILMIVPATVFALFIVYGLTRYYTAAFIPFAITVLIAACIIVGYHIVSGESYHSIFTDRSEWYAAHGVN